MGVITYTDGSTALTRAYVETIPLAVAASTGAPLAVANEAHYFPVRVAGNKPLYLSNADWYVGNATGNIDAGIGTISGTTFTLLASTGAVAASGTNAKQRAALSAGVWVWPDTDYHIAISTSNVVALTMLRCVTGAAAAIGIDTYYKATEHPLTSGVTVIAGANTSAAIPWVRLS